MYNMLYKGLYAYIYIQVSLLIDTELHRDEVIKINYLLYGLSPNKLD
jgi:hypothetical protein